MNFDKSRNNRSKVIQKMHHLCSFRGKVSEMFTELALENLEKKLCPLFAVLSRQLFEAER